MKDLPDSTKQNLRVVNQKGGSNHEDGLCELGCILDLAEFNTVVQKGGSTIRNSPFLGGWRRQ